MVAGCAQIMGERQEIQTPAPVGNVPKSVTARRLLSKLPREM
jgi:hypothetical protein